MEREMARLGHATVVAAPAGSCVHGELYRTGAPASGPDQLAKRDAEHNRRILQLLAADDGFDLVHDMSGTFWKRAGETDVPVLATLHLPPCLYSSEMFEDIAPNVSFNCVSESQLRGFKHLPRMLGVVHNGIDLETFPDMVETSTTETQSHGGTRLIEETSSVPPCLRGASFGSREYLLWLGRICEEKAPHLALDVAERSGLPLLLAGSVYPFSYHQQYFEREIVPRLAHNPRAHFIESPTLSEKLGLLQHARSLLVTSLIEETSSLVALEAMACGTAVVAFRRGALAEIVAEKQTGFLADSIEDIIAALRRTAEIDPRACRERVERCFGASRMANDYERMYKRVLQHASRGQAELRAA
jgi:glycosyltransferase involved in cell wall biosynthesis